MPNIAVVTRSRNPTSGGPGHFDFHVGRIKASAQADAVGPAVEFILPLKKTCRAEQTHLSLPRDSWYSQSVELPDVRPGIQSPGYGEGRRLKAAWFTENVAPGENATPLRRPKVGCTSSSSTQCRLQPVSI